MVYTHSGILPSHKKNEIMPFIATWMHLEMSTLDEVRQRKLPYDITYMWNLKKTKKIPLCFCSIQSACCECWCPLTPAPLPDRSPPPHSLPPDTDPTQHCCVTLSRLHACTFSAPGSVKEAGEAGSQCCCEMKRNTA